MSLAIESADERGCRVVWNGRPLLDYHCGDVKSFIHPLRTLEGDVLTVDRPWDHVWHRGLYFAWKLIDGVNYWGEGLEGPGPWGRMRPVSFEAAIDANGGAQIQQTLLWETAAEGRLDLTESRRLEIGAAGGLPGSYRIDWTSRFKAERDLLLDRTPNDAARPWGGYAGLSFRPARALHAGGARVFNSEGAQSAERLRGGRARWAAFFGPVDGREGGGPDRRAGAAIFDHPSNLRHPTPFYAWDDPVFGFLQAAPLFHEPWPLQAGDEIRLRYGVVVASAELSSEELDAAWTEWSAE